jgi:uracil-DNA glycosylase family 4
MTAAVQTLRLDARQRAMLDEMGVKVWWPTPVDPVAPDEAPAEAAASVVATPAPALAATVRAIVDDAPPPATPRTALAPAPGAPPARAPAVLPVAHGAAVLVDAPVRLYGDVDGAPAPVGGWLIVADMPPEADGRHGGPFEGDAGRLLDNMLRALRLHGGEAPVHLMRTHRGGAAGQPGSPRPLAESFAQHAAALAPQLILAMGPLAAQGLLQSGEPLGKLRGRAVPPALPAGGAASTLLVATYHPAYLLRNPADKARAWADLCLAAEQLPRPLPSA